MKQFELGKTYWTRSIGDHDCIFKITVDKRTAKTLTTIDGKLLRIKTEGSRETVMPYGKYSMAPIIGADRVWSVSHD